MSGPWDSVQHAYRAALVATDAIVVLGLIGLSVVVARNASLKHHSGVARRGFLWFKIALWLTLFAYSLSLGITSAQLHRYLHRIRGTRTTVHLDRLMWFQEWVDTVSYTIVMACIARLAVGTKMAVKQQEAKAYRIFVDVLAALIVVLSFIAMVIRQVVWAKSWSMFDFEVSVLTGYQSLQTAAVSLLIIGGLANTIFSWIQRHATRKELSGAYKSVGTFISAIATIHLVFLLWTLVGSIILVFVAMPYDPAGWFFTNIFVTRIATVVVLYLIYKLGAKEEGGLWLTSEPHGSGVPKSSNEISVSHV